MPEKCKDCCSRLFCMSVAEVNGEDFEAMANKKDCRKRFEEEVNKRVDEAVCKVQEQMWRNESDRNNQRCLVELEKRLIALEKKNGIDHPSHHDGETVRACW